MLHLSTVALLLGLGPLMLAQQKNTLMSNHAKGTFTVDVHPLTPAPAEGFPGFQLTSRFTGI